MLIRAEDESVYNLSHIERFEIATVVLEDEIARRSDDDAEDESRQGGATCEAYVLRAYINGKGFNLVGPTSDRNDAESGLNRIYNMVSERADLHR